MLSESLQPYEHERVTLIRDKKSGLIAIIAIHDTTLGPAFGGCRMWPYASMDEALDDALRLSKGMTYKNALANLSYGGGKSVIVGDPRRDKSEAQFRAFGRFIEELDGKYITAEDVGTTVEDMEIIARETEHAAGRVRGGEAAGGNPSPKTAWGVFLGIRAALEHKFGDDSVKGRHVAVQGVGSVGAALCGFLAEEGAKLTVADVDSAKVDEVCAQTGAAASTVKEILYLDADVVAPCALGGALSAESIPHIQAPVVAGAANNQLRRDEDGDLLAEKDILYAPDFVINAGGIINAVAEVSGDVPESVVWKRLSIIPRNLVTIFSRAEAEKRSTARIAVELAEERLAEVRARKAA